MKFQFRLFVLFILVCSGYNAFSQLTVAGGFTPQQMVQNLLGSGVTAFNVTYTGGTNACGTFNGTSSTIGVSSGILLTTGDIMNAPGPNNNGGAGTSNVLVGDSLLDSLSGVPTFDATILEFDFTSVADTIRFRYVFASEEYNEYVCGTVNDVFGFFLSGPGITGQQNLALVPGTTTPVSINTLNNGSCGNFVFHAGCDTSHSNFFIDNTLDTTVQYDGFTTELTVQTVVTPSLTYHIKLAIADGGDYVYDSGVFLAEGSFTSGVPEIGGANDALIFEIHPNPANGFLVVMAESVARKSTLSIFNVMGIRIYSGILQAEKTELKTSDWNDGVYFVQVTSENKISTRQLIIRH